MGVFVGVPAGMVLLALSQIAAHAGRAGAPRGSDPPALEHASGAVAPLRVLRSASEQTVGGSPADA